MNYLVIFGTVFCLSTTSFAANDGGCQIDGDEINWVTNLYVHPPIQDVDTLEKKFTFTGPLTVTCIDLTDPCRYISPSVDGNTLTFATTEAFVDNFEEETTDVTTKVGIKVNVLLTCISGDTSLTFRVDVTDTNNHDPEFLESTYEYLVPMPMLQNIDITTLGTPILTKDIDFSNENIGFTIDPPEKFVISTQSLGNKQYRAIITVSEAARLSEDTTFQLTAKDDGGKSAVSSVTIKVDKDSSLPSIPKFSGPVFNFDYSEVDGNPVLNPRDGDIVVTSDFPEKTTVLLSENEWCTANYDKGTGLVAINAKSLIVDPVEHVIVLTLNANIDGSSESGTTVILIQVPDNIMIQVPKFSLPFYTAQYFATGETHTVTVDGVISVTENADNIEVALTGENNNYFTLTKNAANNWDLTVATNLPDVILENGGDVVLTLEATVTGESVDKGYGTLIIKLPIKPVIPVPEFSVPYYVADYVIESPTDSVVVRGTVAIKENAANTDVVLNGDNSECFTLTKNADDNWDLTVATNLPDAVLENGEDVVLTLEATVTGESVDMGYGTLIIKLPIKPVIPVPEFSDPYFVADYSTDGEIHTVTVEGTIAVKENAASTNVVLTGDNSECFTLTKNADNNWDLTLVTNLPDAVLEDGGDVVLTLEATVTGETLGSGYATLIIKLPSTSVTPIPEFSFPYYAADYSTDDEIHTVTVKGTIAVKENAASTDVILTGDNSECFTLTKNADNNWDLTLATNLPDAVLENGGDVVLTLEATMTGETLASGYATLIIKLPSTSVTPIPEFSLPYYAADYSTNDETHTVTVKETIAVKENAASTDVVLTGDNSEYFTLTKNADNHWDLTVATNLPDAVLENGGDVVLTLEATVTGETLGSGYATLIIKLPSTSVTPIPEFSLPYYAANYFTEDETHTVTVEGTIAVKENAASTNVVLTGDNSECFTLTKNADNNWDLTVATNLPDIVLEAGEDVILSLKGTTTGQTANGYATLIIKLPSQTVSPVPQFTSPYYTAIYSRESEHDSVVVNGVIEVTKNADKTETVLDGENAEYFTLTKNAENNWELEVKENLTPDILSEGGDLILALKATVDAQTGSAALIIKLPNIAPAPIPKFPKSHYTGTYAQDAAGVGTVALTENIVMDDTFDSLSVTVVDSYAANFNIKKSESDDKVYVIEVKEKLEDAVLMAGTEIVLTLEASVPDQADKGYASVVLNLPQIPTISQILYKAEYHIKDPETDEVEITNGPISYVSDTLAPVTAILTGDLAEEYFTFTDVGDGTCTLLLNKDLDPTILNQGQDVIVTIEASLPWGSKSSASIVIKLPTVSTMPVFSLPVYTAEYLVDPSGLDTITLSSGQTITIIDDDSGAIPVVIADSPYKGNFKLTFNSGIWEISVATDLTSDVINENAQIMLIMDAGASGNQGHAPILVKLPEKTSDIVPEFSGLYYTATYTVDDTNADTVTINEPITITSEQATETAVTVTGTYATNFRADFVATSWQLAVTADFDQDFIDHNTEIYITLEANLEGAKKRGGATVVMKLPSASLLPAPRFVKTHYTAEYKFDGDVATIEMTSDPIAVVGDNSESVTLAGTNSENFKLDHADGLWNLGIETPLDSDVVSAGGEIILEVQAKLDGAIDDGFATLLIKLPDIIPITFDKPYYEATYTANSGTNDDVVTGNEITITQSGTVEITGDFSSNFEINCDTENKCLITVKTDLPEEVLNSQTEVLIALQASKTSDETNKATATVLINLPRKEETNSPRFSQTVYTVTYIRNEGDDAITIDNGPITIPGEDFSKLTVTAEGENRESFTVTPVDDHWEISLAADLPDNVLNEETLLTLELKAVLEGSSLPGSAALVVKLPKKQTPTPFYFNAPIYIGEYVDETTPEIVMEGAILLQGDNLDQVVVNLEGEYTEYFTPHYDGTGPVTVTVTELPNEILDNNLIISLNVVASLLDGPPVTAGLVVKLSQETPGSSISFSNVVYEAEYSNNDGPQIDLDEDITIDGTVGLEIDVKIIGDYAKYFTSTYADGKVTLKAKEIPSSVTDDKAVITVNLEATVSTTTTKALAGVVVKLPLANGGTSGSDDPDETVYIVVICILSVLMVGFILASAFVYYRKRRGRKHADVEDYVNNENKFTRNPKVSEVNKFDHPTRRATGMVRYSISLPDDGSPKESTTDTEETPERRKSVQFDDNVEERPIDSMEHDDSDNDVSSDESDRGSNREEDSVSNRSDESTHHEDRTQM